MSSIVPLAPELSLANGVAMPRVGFGLFRVTPGAPARDVAAEALAAGYRLLDTAAIYRNEAEVGQAVAASGLPLMSVWMPMPPTISAQAHSASSEASPSPSRASKSGSTLSRAYLFQGQISWQSSQP